MKNRILYLVCAGLSVIPIGCNLDSMESKKASEADYTIEKQKIKGSDISQSSFEDHVSALQQKYGISPLPDNLIGENLPSVIKQNSCDACTHPHPIDLPLAKAAATTFELFGIKSDSVPIERPYYEEFTVNQGQAMTVTVTATTGGVDPFLVIFKITEGSLTSYTTQQKLTVVGFNDDYSGLNPKVTTSAFTASTTKVVVLVFAYDPYSKGLANATVKIGGTTFTRPNIAVKGRARFYDDAQQINKSGQLVDVGATGWTRYLPGTTAFATSAYDWGAAYPWGRYKPICTGDSYIWAFNLADMKGLADDDTPDQLCSAVINDATWTPFPSGYHYPNFVLEGGYSDGGWMKFLQVAGFYK